MMTKDCLGSYNLLLKVGDVQHLSYQDGDSGPVYMTSEEREFRKYDQDVGTKLKEMNVDELKDMLKEVRFIASHHTVSRQILTTHLYLF